MVIAAWNAVDGSVLANPLIALLLRLALGAYLIGMARPFYVNPSRSIRMYMQWLPDRLWVRRMVRGSACFCVWGGCFIVATAFATQLAGLHGPVLAVALVLVAALATYLVLPAGANALEASGQGDDSQQKLP